MWWWRFRWSRAASRFPCCYDSNPALASEPLPLRRSSAICAAAVAGRAGWWNADTCTCPVPDTSRYANSGTCAYPSACSCSNTVARSYASAGTDAGPSADASAGTDPSRRAHACSNSSASADDPVGFRCRGHERDQGGIQTAICVRERR